MILHQDFGFEKSVKKGTSGIGSQLELK